LANRGVIKLGFKKYAEVLMDFNLVDEIVPNNSFIYKHRGNAKRFLGDYKGALIDLGTLYYFYPQDHCILKYFGDVKNIFILKVRGIVKMKLKDYVGALRDLDLANELEENDATILKVRGYVKYMICDFKGAWEDLESANKVSPDDEYILQNISYLKIRNGDWKGVWMDLTCLCKLTTMRKLEEICQGKQESRFDKHGINF
jgi:tetratricopeptide (TPR) repeat protein